MRHLPLVVPILLLAALPAFGASSFLGPTGNITTPDDIVVPLNMWEFAYHHFEEVFAGVDFNVASVNYGLAPNLEVGAAFTSDDEDDVVFNAKYRIVDERPGRPSVAVGVFDVASTLDMFGDDAGFYVLASKNITRIATEIVGEPSRPLRLSVGVGSGVFDGLFANLDWTLGSRTSVMLEYINNDFAKPGTGGSSINAGARFAISDMVRLDAATIDFEDFAFGTSVRTTF